MFRSEERVSASFFVSVFMRLFSIKLITFAPNNTFRIQHFFSTQRRRVSCERKFFYSALLSASALKARFGFAWFRAFSSGIAETRGWLLQLPHSPWRW